MTNGAKPTFKQKQFAKEYVRRKGNGAQSALSVYDVKKKNAHVLANQLLKKPIVQQEIKKIMDSAGLNLTGTADFLKEAITSGLGVKATNGDALRGIDMVLKLHNAYPASRSIKLAYTRSEQVASKDMQAVTETLKKLTERASTLLSETE